MLTPVSAIECVQARESASARLDGELPELDEARLTAHLRDCADCRAFAEDAAALAATLRTAPLERPETPVADLPSYRGPLRAIRMQSAVAAVALVAVAAAASFVFGRALGTSGNTPPPAVTAANVVTLPSDFTQQHLLAMLSRLEPVPVRPGRLQAV
jgi:predicted anti-sigma-YlaC factor YlaD